MDYKKFNIYEPTTTAQYQKMCINHIKYSGGMSIFFISLGREPNEDSYISDIYDIIPTPNYFYNKLKQQNFEKTIDLTNINWHSPMALNPFDVPPNIYKQFTKYDVYYLIFNFKVVENSRNSLSNLLFDRLQSDNELKIHADLANTNVRKLDYNFFAITVDPLHRHRYRKYITPDLVDKTFIVIDSTTTNIVNEIVNE